MHSFNFPFQIGMHGNGLDQAAKGTIGLLSCDILVVGTDGLFDNLFEEEILQHFAGNSCSLKATAAASIVEHVFVVSQNPYVVSPHMTEANASGMFHMGGKPDDITVLVALIQ